MKKIINSKFLFLFFIGVFLITFYPKEANACEIEIEIVQGEKEIYKVGDIIVVKVIVTLTHRSCPISIKKTKFEMNGLKVVGATDWKQNSTMVFERKLKIEVLKTKDNKMQLSAIRTCDKDGGFGSLIIKNKN
ncbi:MAG: hypothetical protein U9R42_08080 [Bacteroidota bacterium]|nr:hypothetical protein [Bacteroidota bacterium]